MSLAGRMSGRASSSSRPYAWIVGVLLVLVALVGLQLDRLSTAKISTVATVEYTLSDAIDDNDDDAPRIAGGKAILSIARDISAQSGQSRSSLSGSDKMAQPDAPYSRHARGPPLSV